MDKTERGFGILKFLDEYGKKCSLQESSLATQACIWLGVDDPKPQICIEGEGWKDIPLPEGVYICSRMHLTQEDVSIILPYLQRFMETGYLREEMEGE